MRADQIILHQYDASPFSEKVRVMLGVKGLSWKSCIQPVIMPKPDLVALTGGYRKIPVMQIGADIWCDSRAILNELERRYPAKAGDLGHGLGNALAVWTDRTLFGLTIPIIFGGSSFTVDEAFKKDREQLSGAPFNPDAMKAAIPYARAALRAHLTEVDRQLSDGRAFLAGAQPSLADAAVSYILYFVGFAFPGGEPLFPDLTHLNAWRGRVAAIGHGERSEISREETLAIARAAKPAAPKPSLADDPSGLKPGMKVTVSADDYGRDPIAGELTSIGADHITILRSDPAVGEVAVHFPRFGFVAAPA